MRTSSLAQVFPVQVKCVTAATHSFPVHTAVKCKVKVDRYTWKFTTFYVVEDLIHPVILGSDFFAKNRVTDLHQGFAFFRFDPDNKLPLIGRTPALDSPCVCMSTETCPDLSHLTQSSANSVLEVIN
jgi:hypothetical protein